MTKKTRKEKDTQFIKIAVAVVLIILAMWLVCFFLLKDMGQADRSSYGEMFGAVNALFSGLALAGIILTIFLQRRELKETREEFKIENDISRTQQFESTFFNLLENQQRITNNLKTRIWDIGADFTRVESQLFEGREFFISSRRELKRILNSFAYKSFGLYDQMTYMGINPEEFQDPDEVKPYLVEAKMFYTDTYYNILEDDWKKAKHYDLQQQIRLAYSYFLTKHHHIIGHYFRHLFYIFRFIESAENKELKNSIGDGEAKTKKKYYRYAQFIQAQMSANELMLTYYHSLIYPNFKKMVIKYHILENVAIEDLVDPSHNVISGVNLKNRRTIFEL